jgi:2,3-bisphosphoglycerate-independent phosphoglycerate mutase
MGQYDKNFTFPVAFPPEDMKNILSKVLSDNGLTQLRIAETEKYAHVTFFFNGQIENPFPLEERILIPSPPVPTYDMQPEMSAFEVTEKLLKRIEEQKDDVIILNFANPDMVGHTGNMNATVTALKAIDRLLERIIETLKSRGTAVLLTADHGNADMMEDSEGNTVTAHTTSRVPFILINAGKEKSLRKDGKLADVAPTLLDLLKIKKPEEMTGKSLIEE